MREVKVVRHWEDFLAFAETEDADKHFCEKAKKLYARMGMCEQVKAAARMAGFGEFEVWTKEFTHDEARWISIFEEMEKIEHTLNYLCDDSAESADVYAAINGVYKDDGSVQERVRQLNVRLEELAAERKTLCKVEEFLYPQPVAYGLPRRKRWLD